MALFSQQFEAIGTGWFISFEGTMENPDDIWKEIHDRIAVFDKQYSRFRDDSLVAQIAQQAGTYTVPADALSMLSLYIELYRLTEGAFTPLIGSTLVEAGYDAAYSLQPQTLHTPPRLEEVLRYTHPTLTVLQPALLDFGAAGKGYLIDIIAALLRARDVRVYTIDAGGDIAVFDTTGAPAVIGLEDPTDVTKAIGTVALINKSICGSAGNRRTWAQYHHIIDPHRLQSPRDIEAVWVIAETTMLADAIATCLYFTPASLLQQVYQFEYLILRPDYSIEQSQQFAAHVFV